MTYKQLMNELNDELNQNYLETQVEIYDPHSGKRFSVESIGFYCGSNDVVNEMGLPNGTMFLQLKS